MPTYADMRRGYGNMWGRAQVRGERRAATVALAKRITANKSRYAAAAAISPGMPWWWVGAVHSLEAGLSWSTHLHNGDPLSRRTTHVPAGRPAGGSPPFTWEASACDALTLHALEKVPSWEIERCLYEWERYNGFGYIARRVNSPYLWSFTNQYERGKYVVDGRFDVNAVSQQCGCVAIAKVIGELENASPPPVVVDLAPVGPPAAPVGREVARAPEWDVVGWILTAIGRLFR